MQDHSLARRAMIDSQLRPEAVTDGHVLGAMGSVRREQYVPEAARAFAYFDRPLKLGGGRAMMPPAALGRLLGALAPRPGERALVIGAGSGYSAALLGAIGLDVSAHEADPALAAMARDAGIAIQDGDYARVTGGPFDLILIDGAIDEVPAEIAALLGPGGRIGAALVDRGVTRLAIGGVSGGAISMRSFADADVAILPGFARPLAFVF